MLKNAEASLRQFGNLFQIAFPASTVLISHIHVCMRLNDVVLHSINKPGFTYTVEAVPLPEIVSKNVNFQGGK